MNVYNFKIAGFRFRVESDIRIYGLENEKFLRFKKNSTKVDILLRFISIPKEKKYNHVFKKKEKNLLLDCFIYPYKNLDNQFLSHPLVRNCLKKCYDHLDFVSLEVRSSSLSILDFKKSQAHIFIDSKSIENLKNSRMRYSMFAPFLNPFYAIMLHSSAVIIDNSVSIFLASDEGGKTTIAKNYPEETILCDDQIIIRKEGKKYKAYSTPWGKYLNESLNSKVGAFFLLEKSDYFKLIPINKKYIINYLWIESIGNYFILPEKLKKQHFQLLCDLAYSIPAYRLYFPKDSIDKELIKATLIK